MAGAAVSGDAGTSVLLLASKEQCGSYRSAQRRASEIRPTQQRAGALSDAPGLLLCQEAGVSPGAPGRRPERASARLQRRRPHPAAKAIVCGPPRRSRCSADLQHASAGAAPACPARVSEPLRDCGGRALELAQARRLVAALLASPPRRHARALARASVLAELMAEEVLLQAPSAGRLNPSGSP